MTQPKQPPPGVETAPQGPVVSLQEAASRLGKDPRTVIRAITAGEIRGGAMPRPERLRWYVYTDALPGEASTAATPPVSDVGDLRAQIVSLSEANRLLIAAQQELLDADRATNDAAEKYRAVARSYLDALAQFMTPGHLGDLADL
jgi:predicted nucleic acid-binding protein